MKKHKKDKKKGKKNKGGLNIEARSMSHGDVIREILETINEDRDEDKQLRRGDVKEVLDSYLTIALNEINDNGIFAIPGIVKLIRKYKPAREKRKGINPFTGGKCVFKAKPATYQAKARPLAKVKVAARGEL